MTITIAQLRVHGAQDDVTLVTRLRGWLSWGKLVDLGKRKIPPAQSLLLRADEVIQ